MKPSTLISCVRRYDNSILSLGVMEWYLGNLSNLHHCQCKILDRTVIKSFSEGIFVLFAVVLAHLVLNDFEVLEKCADSKVYNMRKARNSSILKINVNIVFLLQSVGQTDDQCLVVAGCISCNTEQLLGNIEFFNSIFNILSQVCTCVPPFKRDKCKQDVVKLEIGINPVCCNAYL
jgi:hypothetical protein